MHLYLNRNLLRPSSHAQSTTLVSNSLLESLSRVFLRSEKRPGTCEVSVPDKDVTMAAIAPDSDLVSLIAVESTCVSEQTRCFV